MSPHRFYPANTQRLVVFEMSLLIFFFMVKGENPYKLGHSADGKKFFEDVSSG